MRKYLVVLTVGLLIVSQSVLATEVIEKEVQVEATTQAVPTAEKKATAEETQALQLEAATAEIMAQTVTKSQASNATAQLAEDQIPLKIEAAQKANESTENSSKMLLSLVVIAGLLGAGYFYMRRYSMANKGSKNNMQIKVLTQHFLGPKKSLAIIRVAGESILIGVTDNNISMLKSLALLDEELPQVIPKDFDQTMTEKTEMMAQAEEMEDDFSFAGLKTTVAQKLKSMRSIQ